MAFPLRDTAAAAGRKANRPLDRYVYAVLAAAFALGVFAGFSKTYYLKALFGGPPLPSATVHLHGLVMTSWVLLFAVQVALISSRRVRVHQRLGYASIALAVLIVVIGLRTALEAARHGSLSTPVGFSEPTFSIVPLGDLLLFMMLYGGAVYYRRMPSRHKSLMFLTAINFMPPAIGRLPFDVVRAYPVVFGLGVPVVLTLAVLALDWRKRRRFDGVVVTAAVIFIVSFPLRIALVSTPAWTRAATWLASLVD
jgi:hypothetical protein